MGCVLGIEFIAHQIPSFQGKYTSPSNKGPAKSPWPMFGQNPHHTGRALKK